MKPHLKRVHSPDVDDLVAYVPSEPDRFGVLVQLMIGPASGGEESFDVVVCSPQWLTEQLASAAVIDLRHHLLISSWDWSQVSQYIEAVLAGVDEPTWEEVAAVVGRLGHWEFEDYEEG